VLGYDVDDIGIDYPTDRDPFDLWPYPPYVMDVVDQIGFWYRSKDWFQARGIPWRTGLTVYGPPGTGKTTLLKAIAQRYDLPVYLFDLASMSNNEFVHFWHDALDSTPCMVVIEEVDAVFNESRENICGEQGGGLSFDTVLSTISGMANSDGVCLGVTTNHLDRIDPALGAPDEHGHSQRPGRIEHLVGLGAMEEPERRAVVRRILDNTGLDLDQVVRDTEGLVPDNVVHYCSRLAYQAFWDRGRSAAEAEVNPSYDLPELTAAESVYMNA
jgi:SpoVK/Ycf46/Vps4 family AAA+-type ATPase